MSRAAPFLILLARVGLGGLLILAGALKVRAPGTFAAEIANYQLLPGLAPYLAPLLPTVELTLGGALLLAPRAWRQAAALAAAVLLAGFTTAVASAYFRGINIDCGCFGAGGGPITVVTILRNLALWATACALVRFQASPARPMG
jgi:putative oxidoreductase